MAHISGPWILFPIPLPFEQPELLQIVSSASIAVVVFFATVAVLVCVVRRIIGAAFAAPVAAVD